MVCQLGFTICSSTQTFYSHLVTKLQKNSSYEEIQQAIVGYVYGDSTCGQRALYQFGQTGIPIYNVNNNCATG